MGGNNERARKRTLWLTECGQTSFRWARASFSASIADSPAARRHHLCCGSLVRVSLPGPPCGEPAQKNQQRRLSLAEFITAVNDRAANKALTQPSEQGPTVSTPQTPPIRLLLLMRVVSGLSAPRNMSPAPLTWRTRGRTDALRKDRETKLTNPSNNGRGKRRSS